MTRMKLRILIGLVLAVALAWGASPDLRAAAKAAAKATSKAAATKAAATKATDARRREDDGQGPNPVHAASCRPGRRRGPGWQARSPVTRCTSRSSSGSRRPSRRRRRSWPPSAA